ncbi:MAG: YkgJ family cysteine cluster protein [Candidatus Omnitrophota bacterium]
MGIDKYARIYGFVGEFYPWGKEDILFLISLYDKLDEHIERFKAVSGLKCIEDCGLCCGKSNFEATAMEFMPLAVDLWIRKEISPWLEKISLLEQGGPCVFYKADASVGEGKCSVYSFRPLICRLFGFSARTDKYGKRLLITCGCMKKAHPLEYKQSQGVAFQNIIPRMSDYSIQAPTLGKQIPINEAAKTALEKMEMIMKLKAG